LQREHLRRITAALTKPGAGTPADAISLLRDDAERLVTVLRTAKARAGLSRETRAHYAQSQDALEAALRAQWQRDGS